MKKKDDQELMRLQALLRSVEHLEEQWYAFQGQLGTNAERRATAYLQDRMGWFFEKFTQKQND